MLKVQASLPPEQSEQSTEQSSTATPSNNEAQMESMREADSFFSQKSAAPPQANPPLQQQQQSNVPYTRQRPFQEIVSEVQGSCIFLQESTIDMECMLSGTLFPLITSSCMFVHIHSHHIYFITVKTIQKFVRCKKKMVCFWFYAEKK